MRESIYPLTIIGDRYSGAYSGGEYIAWNMYPNEIPAEVDSGDVECNEFWLNYKGIYGKGSTSQEAINDLKTKLL